MSAYVATQNELDYKLLLAAATEPAAMEALHRVYNARLVALISTRTGDPALAEDVAQDALLRAADRAGTFQTGKPLWPWLRKVAINVAIDTVRLKDNQHAPLPAADVMGETHHPDVADALSRRDLVLAALREIPERQREALVLCYLEDWEPMAIARRLGIERAAVDMLLYRARRSLRVQYERMEADVGRIRLLVPLWLWFAAARSRARERIGGLRNALSGVREALPAAAEVTTVAVLAVTTAVAAVGVPRAASADADASGRQRVHITAHEPRFRPGSDNPRPEREPAPAMSVTTVREPRIDRDGGSEAVGRSAPGMARRQTGDVTVRTERASADNRVATDEAVSADTEAQAEAQGEEAIVESSKVVRCDGRVGSAVCAGADQAVDVVDDLVP